MYNRLSYRSLRCICRQPGQWRLEEKCSWHITFVTSSCRRTGPTTIASAFISVKHDTYPICSTSRIRHWKACFEVRRPETSLSKTGTTKRDELARPKRRCRRPIFESSNVQIRHDALGTIFSMWKPWKRNYASSVLSRHCSNNASCWPCASYTMAVENGFD